MKQQCQQNSTCIYIKHNIYVHILTTVRTVSTSAATFTRLSNLRTIQPVAQLNSRPRKTCINNCTVMTTDLTEIHNITDTQVCTPICWYDNSVMRQDRQHLWVLQG